MPDKVRRRSLETGFWGELLWRAQRVRSFEGERAVLTEALRHLNSGKREWKVRRRGVWAYVKRIRESPLVQPVTETKCGPWLHWHRGQSSRSHTPASHSHSHSHYHLHQHTRVRVRSQVVQRCSVVSVTTRRTHGRCKTQVLDTTQLTQILIHPSYHSQHTQS